MRASLSALLTLALALALLPGSAAAKKSSSAPSTAAQAGPTVTPPKNVFLRNAFDTDPSNYMGRFIPDGTAPAAIDETIGMPLPCSSFITTKTVGGGNVSYDELFAASSEASARVGVPPILSGGGSADQSTVIRVKYKLTQKMQSVIADPAGFAACCAQGPDQCTGLYLGEFLAGTGSVWFASASEAEGKVSGAGTKLAGEIEASRGVMWQKSITFEEPVYFAFKTTPNRGSTSACSGDWVNTPPVAPDGKYFVGVSNPMQTEQLARDAALGDGRKAVVTYIGERITMGQVTTTSTAGGASNLSSRLQSNENLTRAASGVANFVKDRCWRIDDQARPDGTWKLAHVLVFLPKSEEDRAAAAILAAMGPE